jgi:hypothetical protein
MVTLFALLLTSFGLNFAELINSTRSVLLSDESKDAATLWVVNFISDNLKLFLFIGLPFQGIAAPFGDGEVVASEGGDSVFDESLEEFDEEMNEEQEQLARAGGGQAADEGLPTDAERFGGAGNEESDIGQDVAQPRDLGLGTEVFADRPVNPSVEGCNDEDLVARQLCELATVEEDPFLKGELWREYNEYRRLVAQQ